MKNNENNVKRIYDKQTKTWFEVSPEQYEEFDRWRTNLRKREQYHHRCMCPRSKWWLCDGMCQDCEFHAPGDTLSLDMPVSNEDGDEVTLLDTLVDPAPTIESKAACLCGKLRQEGLSDAAIAEIIGIKRTTFLSRLKKAKEQLATEFPDRF